MKRFCLKILFFVVPLFSFLVICFVIIHEIFKHKIDAFYLRTINTHDQSLIIGTSRAAQSIDPAFLQKPTYNFAFTISNSPFDSSYLDLIKKFHKPSKALQTNHHIICVDPWALSSFKNNPNEIRNNSFVNRIAPGNGVFNLQYLINESPSAKNIFLNVFKRKLYINHYGRLIVPFSKSSCRKNFNYRLKEKIALYKKSDIYKRGHLSTSRISCLRSAITYLQQTGTVCLVRLPIHKKMFELENKIAPNFDNEIIKISQLSNIKYFNLTHLNDSFLYTDGNHIWNGDSRKLTLLLQKKLDLIEYNE
jgi:hypothetical protein